MRSKALRSNFKKLTTCNFILWSVIVVFLTIPSSQAQHIDPSKSSISQLIDQLTHIDSRLLGLDSAAVYEGFLADGSNGAFRMGVLGVPTPEIAPQMQELVRRGQAALPELLAHITDSRLTQLRVGNDESKTSTPRIGIDAFMFSYFSDEYDPQAHHLRDETRIRSRPRPQPLERSFHGQYTVKVGDVCFVLIGQIVNRQLFAVRYQPSAGLVVNSPLEASSLAQAVKADWDGKDAGALESSLLSDIRLNNHTKNDDWNVYASRYINPAFRRLRLYFPDAYNSLEGDDLKKRREFERLGAKDR